MLGGGGRTGSEGEHRRTGASEHAVEVVLRCLPRASHCSPPKTDCLKNAKINPH